MQHSDLELRLLNRLRARGQAAIGLGIDLGTTKSSVAYARFDPAVGRLSCDCVRFAQADGTARIGVPSVVAVTDEGPQFGVAALALRGRAGFRAERKLFYDSKNEIGLRYTYARAPDGFRNAGEVAAQLLCHLRAAIVDPELRAAPAPTVVTVPASFHGAQRTATLRAGEQAFGAGAVRLLDEPYAAFLDLKWRHPARAEAMMREDANVMVFDFGGGTCDVAIFRIDSVRGGTLGARLLGTSRYHRLGGGDVDRAIVHDVLIPALAVENGLERWNLSWADKRRFLEPQLLSTAERLKVALSRKVADLRAAGVDVDETLAVASVALNLDLDAGGQPRPLQLARPSLDLTALRALMRPFLDPDPPPEAGDEFVQRSSMFAPIVQALFRAGLDREDVHGILLCGSSSQMPLVQDALAAQFPEATRVLLGDPEQLEGAVARGAALQALSLQVLGEPLIAPVCSAEVSLRVVSGAVPLSRAGDAVPCASRVSTLLRPPRDSRFAATDIAVEVIADGQRLVGRSLWSLPAPVSTEDRLALDWRMDENQCIELRLSRMDNPDTEPFRQRFDAPITHRDAGQLVRCRKLEREESIRNGDVPPRDLGGAFQALARDCAALGEYEKALHFVSLAMQELGATLMLMNLRGIYREQVGNREGARESYEAAAAWPVARFNLALLHYHAARYAEALTAVDSAMEDDPNRISHVLRGDILHKLGEKDRARAEWQDAIAGQIVWEGVNDCELIWLERAARALEHTAIRDRIAAERKRFATQSVLVQRQGELPEYVGAGGAQATPRMTP